MAFATACTLLLAGIVFIVWNLATFLPLGRYRKMERSARWVWRLQLFVAFTLDFAFFVFVAVRSAPPENAQAPVASVSVPAVASVPTPAIVVSPVVAAVPALQSSANNQAPPESGQEIIASAPPDSAREERTGIWAFCSVMRDLPNFGATADSATMILTVARADQLAADRLGEPLDRANIVVSRIAESFGQGIYGPADCATAMRDEQGGE